MDGYLIVNVSWKLSTYTHFVPQEGTLKILQFFILYLHFSCLASENAYCLILWSRSSIP